MIKIKNVNRIKAAIREKQKEFQQALYLGLREGLRQYEAFVISDQLNGRKSPTYGLNPQSGIARNSLDVKMDVKGNVISGTLTVAQRAWYLKVHQHLNFDGYIRAKNKPYLTFKTKEKKWVRKKQVFVPKRLYLHEKFRVEGRRYIENRLIRHLERL